jgi:hypothetical protein
MMILMYNTRREKWRWARSVRSLKSPNCQTMDQTRATSKMTSIHKMKKILASERIFYWKGCISRTKMKMRIISLTTMVTRTISMMKMKRSIKSAWKMSLETASPLLRRRIRKLPLKIFRKPCTKSRQKL